MDSLVSTEWLAANLGQPGLSIVDSSWHMPASGRNGAEEFAAEHIPGARFLDIDAVVRPHVSGATHARPPAEDFGAAMVRLGIGRDDRIVVYDNSPLRTAARGWFMFRHFGAGQVAILDGGFQKWQAEGRPVKAVNIRRAMQHFNPAERADVVTKSALLDGSPHPILDARGAGQFEGSEPDPRPGVAAGHIPGARNLPFGALYRDNGTFKRLDEIRKLFEQAGIDPAQPFIASCGSGVTANSLLFAAHLLGNDEGKLYDGSWSEWGSDPATPKALGPA